MTTERDPQTVEEFAQRIASLNIDEQLVREQALGVSLSFEPGREAFREALKVAASIRDLPTHTLQNTSHYNQLTNSLSSLLGALSAVMDFDPNVNQPSNQRDQRIVDVRANVVAVREAFVPLAGYLMLESGGLGDVEGRLAEIVSGWDTRATEALEGQQARLASAIQQAENSAETANEAATAAQSAAGRTGVTQYSRVFEDEAAYHRKHAMKWLVAGVVLLVALFALAIVIIRIPVGDEIDDPQVVQWILLKALVLSFVSYLVFQAFRMYRSEQHLSVTSRHRDKALRTFETFATAATEGSTRDAVLVEATRTIFAPGVTGLVDQGDSAPPPAALLEVFRGSQGQPPTGN